MFHGCAHPATSSIAEITCPVNPQTSISFSRNAGPAKRRVFALRYTISRFSRIDERAHRHPRHDRRLGLVDDGHRAGIRRVGEHRHDVESRRRDEHLLQRRQRLQPAGVDAGLLGGLAQRGVHRAVVAGVGRAAGKRGLAGVVAQRRRPDGHQQVGVVGQPARPASPAGPRTAPAPRRRGSSRSAWPAALAAVTIASTFGGHPAAVGAASPRRALSTSGFSQAGAASGVSRLRSLAELTPALLSVGSTAAAISSAVANERGRISATLPSARSTTVAGMTLGTCSAAAIKAPAVLQRRQVHAQLGQPQQRGGLVLVLVHRQHRHGRHRPAADTRPSRAVPRRTAHTSTPTG